MRSFLVMAAAGLVLTGCASSPKSTLAELNSRDPAYRSRECVQARRAVAAYDDHKEGKVVIGLLGNLVVPFAGTAATAVMTGMQEDDKKALNHRLRAACTSDPLAKRKGRRVARR